MLPSFENVPPPLLSDILVRKRSFLFNNEKGNAANVSNFNIMASGINFYSQLVISAIRIADISNLISDITNLK